MPKYIDRAPKGMVLLLHKNPYFAYAKLVTELFTIPILEIKVGIAPTAFVHKTAKLGKGVEMCHGAYIGENVKIGDNCKIGVNSVINHDCEIGNNCIIDNSVSISYTIMGKNSSILNGARIGQRGFGFAHNEGFNHRIPQLGIVRIGDYVEIGANTCIDRGALEDTIIGNNTQLDNLIQIAHGVKIGQGCFFAGGSAVAGSAKIGNFVQVGGNSSITGHIEIGDGAQIAGHSGVAQSVKPMQAVAGYPNLPIRDWHKINVKLKQMIKKGV
jgi:UDP-3-O-[3-hydroxymyristoyl] glucosamine N-acyltransferase